jgi:hypothetical protein
VAAACFLSAAAAGIEVELQQHLLPWFYAAAVIECTMFHQKQPKWQQQKMTKAAATINSAALIQQSTKRRKL